jgi:hypothetical protein
MDIVQQIILLINGLCLVIILYLAATVIDAGARYNWHIGDPTVQIPLRWKIWRCLIGTIVIALIMAVINLASPYL